jgi:hypothetical protein
MLLTVLCCFRCTLSALCPYHADTCATLMQVKTKTRAQSPKIDNPAAAAENHVSSETIIRARADGGKGARDGRGTLQAPAEAPKGFPFHVALPPPLFDSLSDEHLRRESGIGSSSLCTRQSCTSSCRDSDEGTDADQASIQSRDPLDGSSLFNTPSSFSSCSKHLVLMASTGDLDQDKIVAYGAEMEAGEQVRNDGIGLVERRGQPLQLVPPIPWNAHSNQSETPALDRQDFGPTSKQLFFVSLSAVVLVLYDFALLCCCDSRRGDSYFQSLKLHLSSPGTLIVGSSGKEGGHGKRENAESAGGVAGVEEESSPRLIVMMMKATGSQDMFTIDDVDEMTKELTDSFPLEG